MGTPPLFRLELRLGFRTVSLNHPASCVLLANSETSPASRILKVWHLPWQRLGRDG